MAPHQQRVIDEKAELDERLAKLKDFFLTDIFINIPMRERMRLERQATVMQHYSNILGERIAEF